MMDSDKPFQYSIRKVLTALFVFAAILVTALNVSLHFSFSTQKLESNTIERFNSFASATRNQISHNEHDAAKVVDLLATFPNLRNLNQRQKLTIFSQALVNRPHAHGLYYADLMGNFFEVVNLNNTESRSGYKATQSEHWLIMKIRHHSAERRFFYYNENMRLVRKKVEPTSYNPTQRNWFMHASVEVQHSAPYTFRYSQKPGVTYFKKSSDGQAVIGLDISLNNLSGSLSEELDEFTGQVYLMRQNGEIITDNQSQDTMHRTQLAPLPLDFDELLALTSIGKITVSNSLDWAPVDFAISGMPKGYAVELFKLVSERLNLKYAFINGYHWSELTAKFNAGDIDVLNAVYNTPINNQLGLLSDPIGVLPLALLSKSNVKSVSRLKQINGKRLGIAKGWSIQPLVVSRYPDIKIFEYEDSLEVIQAVNNNEVDFAIESEINLIKNLASFNMNELHVHPLDEDKLIPTTLHFLLKPDATELQSLINKAIASIKEQYIPRLNQRWLSNSQNPSSSLKVFPYIEELAQAIAKPEEQLMTIDTDQGQKLMYVSTVDKRSGDMIAFVVDQGELFAPVYINTLKSVAIIILLVMLFMPLAYTFASPIVKPIIQLVNMTHLISNRQYSQVSVTTSNITEIRELSLAMKDMTDIMDKHESAQQQLIDAIIQLIAQAIDDKSPYTAGHCARVPELGMMLAKYADSVDTGVLSEFKFTSDEQWREFKTAAWLHDCGKITTPEHIVDKGSKLECIYNRIHEIRTRFEVLLRDARIEYHQSCIQYPNKEPEYQQLLQSKEQTLNHEFAFVASCNVGGEFLSEEAKQKLATIAQRTWYRHFDNTLGLSPLESIRAVTNKQLPVKETLLADTPEHIIRRHTQYHCPPELNINMDIPEFLANQGELYNLSISRGTLTTEDRFRINEHIISTIKILDNVPFPPELANVPRIASTHHETMRGDGYPRRLKGEDLSIPERILALADIFEALTASDRPYKKAKTLSESMIILHKMVLSNHLDKDVYNLFLTSGCYKDYAEQYLPKEQLDTVDINQFII